MAEEVLFSVSCALRWVPTLAKTLFNWLSLSPPACEVSFRIVIKYNTSEAILHLPLFGKSTITKANSTEYITTRGLSSLNRKLRGKEKLLVLRWYTGKTVRQSDQKETLAVLFPSPPIYFYFCISVSSKFNTADVISRSFICLFMGTVSTVNIMSHLFAWSPTLLFNIWHPTILLCWGGFSIVLPIKLHISTSMHRRREDRNKWNEM